MAARNVMIKNLAEVRAAREALPPEMKPTKMASGKWRKAKWGALRIAREKRNTIMRGEEWKWDIPKKEVVKLVPFKGHKRHAIQAERRANVERCMARMPQLVAEYRESRRAQRREKKQQPGFAGILQAEARDRNAGVKTRLDASGKGKGKGGK